MKFLFRTKLTKINSFNTTLHSNYKIISPRSITVPFEIKLINTCDITKYTDTYFRHLNFKFHKKKKKEKEYFQKRLLITIICLHFAYPSHVSMYRSRAYYPISTIASQLWEGWLVSGNGGRCIARFIKHKLIDVSRTRGRRGGYRGIVADVTNCQSTVEGELSRCTPTSVSAVIILV